MLDGAFDWIEDVAASTVPGPTVNKVDTHHHFVPDFYAKAVEDAGGDPSGWPTPKWAPAASEAIMHSLGIRTAILSLTAPGACILGGQASSALARQSNDFCAALRDTDPGKWGFFATLPSLLDTEAALAEIAHAFDVCGADGVTVFTRYGEGNAYLGHADLEPVWRELDAREAVVFVHPTHAVDTNMVNPKMPQPLIDYPHETTRAAMDMIVQGTRRKYPNCKVVLSHAGGALPYLVSRVAMTSQALPDVVAGAGEGLTREQVMADFRSFHYDVALSAAPGVLRLLLDSVPHDHILYGSDFPYAPPPAYKAFSEGLEGYEMRAELRAKINYKNAFALIPRLAKHSNL